MVVTAVTASVKDKMEFIEFPKIPRYSRDCVITEKIDGTNASIYIPEIAGEVELPSDAPFLVGSRTRWITPEQDNAGFARWAYNHANELLDLGPGHHFGEWWGSGIQRGYDLPKGEKRFSLFNVHRWSDPETRPKCCHVVPVISLGPTLFSDIVVSDALEYLRTRGSLASPGFMRPEGIVIYHKAGKYLFKKTIEKDDAGKGYEI